MQQEVFSNNENRCYLILYHSPSDVCLEKAKYKIVKQKEKWGRKKKSKGWLIKEYGQKRRKNPLGKIWKNIKLWAGYDYVETTPVIYSS